MSTVHSSLQLLSNTKRVILCQCMKATTRLTLLRLPQVSGKLPFQCIAVSNPVLATAPRMWHSFLNYCLGDFGDMPSDNYIVSTVRAYVSEIAPNLRQASLQLVVESDPTLAPATTPLFGFDTERKLTAMPSQRRSSSMKARIAVLACVMLLHRFGKVPVILFVPTLRYSSCNTATQLIVVQSDVSEVCACLRLYK